MNLQWLFVLLGVSLSLGCIQSSDVRIREEFFGSSQEHRSIKGWILSREKPPYKPAGYAEKEFSETLLIFAAIHGNEPLGVPLAERLIDELKAHPYLLEKRRAVIIPIVNPDGLARRSRYNVNGVDLNRNFPAKNWKPRGKRHGTSQASESETQALIAAMKRYPPTRILSIHAPLHCINYDGPAEKLAREMAQLSGYPVRENIGYPTPGSFGSWAGADLNIPVITLELRRNIKRSELWPEMGAAVLSFINPPGANALSSGEQLDDLPKR